MPESAQKLKRKKVGRPKLPKGSAKAGKVQVRLSPEEQKRIEAAAKARNQKVSEWIRVSMEEAQMVKMMVRILDRAENKYDWFIGVPQECPPLPRIGEFVKCAAGEGIVKSIEHEVEEINTKRTGSGPWDTYYKTLVRLG